MPEVVAADGLEWKTATIYWNPDAMDELLAVGEERILNPQGGVDEPEQKDKQVVSQIISLS